MIPGFAAIRPRLAAAGLGLLAAALFGAIVVADGGRTAGLWREAVADALLLATRRAPADDRVLVVDVDRDSLLAVGPWPWPRAATARLLSAVAAGRPAAVAVDMLFAGAREPAGDGALAEAIAEAPTVLAALFSDRTAEGPARPAPVAVAGAEPGLSPWREAGASGPAPLLAEAAAGIGVAALAPDADGVVRRVPLVAVAGGAVLTGLAAETVRVAEGAAALLVDGRTGRLRIGTHDLPLAAAADLRILPSPRTRWAGRRVSAAALLRGEVPAERIRGRIVVVGGSAPALGSLRMAAASPVTPSVEIQADAIETILGGRVPVRPPGAGPAEAAAAALLSMVAAAAGASLGPLAAVAATLALAGGLVAAGAGAIVFAAVIVDPVTPAAAVTVAGTGAILAAGVAARRQAAAIRRRFEQHLAPAVVARIVARPDLVKLGGERRTVTALFTDVEGFTALTDRLDPEVLVALLDRYFGVVTAIVTAHGGMVDKIVGDAVHALFNAPLDLSDHAEKAVAAALAVRQATEALRREPEIAPLGLGRTRIGIETGPAVVGDVGSGDKLDYTAHGSAVNTAARLEAAAKGRPEAILVGPACRAACGTLAFRSLGPVEIRGLGPVEVFTPEA